MADESTPNLSKSASEELTEEQLLEKKQKKNKILFAALIAVFVLLSGAASYVLVQHWFDDIYKAYKFSRPESTHMVEFNRLTINVGRHPNQRIIMISITLEVASRTDANTLEERSSQFLDMINSLTASKEISVLTTNNGREELRNELLFMINERLQYSSLKNVYFSEYVIQ